MTSQRLDQATQAVIDALNEEKLTIVEQIDTARSELQSAQAKVVAAQEEEASARINIQLLQDQLNQLEQQRTIALLLQSGETDMLIKSLQNSEQPAALYSHGEARTFIRKLLQTTLTFTTLEEALQIVHGSRWERVSLSNVGTQLGKDIANGDKSTFRKRVRRTNASIYTAHHLFLTDRVAYQLVPAYVQDLLQEILAVLTIEIYQQRMDMLGLNPTE